LDTLTAYDDAAEFLRSTPIDSAALTKSIIGTISEIDHYQLPEAKGYTAFVRHLLEVSDSYRQQRREEVLGTTQADFKAFADVLEAVRGPEARVVAVTSTAALKALHEDKPGFFEEVHNVM
jgi:presequence protease